MELFTPVGYIINGQEKAGPEVKGVVGAVKRLSDVRVQSLLYCQ